MGRRQTDRGEYRQPAVPWLRLGLTSLLLATAVSSPLYAHGFGQRYDLPIPLWLYLLGAGATVGFRSSWSPLSCPHAAPETADCGLHYRVAVSSADRSFWLSEWGVLRSLRLW